MRARGQILLVSCYELGHQPLSLAWPVAFLEAAGYRPVAVDTAVEPLTDDVIRAARFVGISVPMHTALRLGIQVAERVRAQNSAAHVCVFGLYAHLNARYLVPRFADSTLAGEYEAALVEEVRRVETFASVKASAAPILRRLPFPVPARDQLPALEHYARLEVAGEQRLAGYVEATRGCLHTCLHCPITPIYGGRFFAVPADVVLADVRQQVAAGARHITFGDPDFLNGPGHALRIVRALHAEFPELTFDATIKIEHILERRDLFPELAASGCAFVLSAVESVSDSVLRHLAKGHTRQDVAAAIAILDAAGIPLRASLVPFTPWTTLDDYLDLLRFVEAHDLIDHIDPVQYSIRLLVPPGSALLDQPDAAAWIGELDEAAFTYRWQHPDPRLEALQEAVYARVAEATDRREPVAATFRAIRALALEAAGRTAPDLPFEPVLAGVAAGAPTKVPRLTESWFC